MIDEIRSDIERLANDVAADFLCQRHLTMLDEEFGQQKDFCIDAIMDKIDTLVKQGIKDAMIKHYSAACPTIGVLKPELGGKDES